MSHHTHHQFNIVNDKSQNGNDDDDHDDDDNDPNIPKPTINLSNQDDKKKQDTTPHAFPRTQKFKVCIFLTFILCAILIFI